MQQGESVSAPAPPPQYEKSEKYLSDYLKTLKNKNKNQNGLKKQKIDLGLNFIFKIMLNRQI